MQLQTKPRLYSDVNKHMNESYYNYEAYEIEYGYSQHPLSDIDQFEIITKIGKGKYSEVYTGISTLDDKTIVIKALKPVKKSKIKREIKILKALNGHPAIIELKDVVRDPASKSISLVPHLTPRSLTTSKMLISAHSSPVSPT
jgi:casein kinase II subunit alpha